MGGFYAPEQRAEWLDLMLDIIRRQGPLGKADILAAAHAEAGIAPTLAGRLLDDLVVTGMVKRRFALTDTYREGGTRYCGKRETTLYTAKS